MAADDRPPLEALLWKRLDEELDVEEHLRLERRIEEDGEIRRASREIATMTEWLQRLPAVEPPAALMDGVRQAIRSSELADRPEQEDEVGASQSSLRRWPPGRPAIAGRQLLALAAAAGLLLVFATVAIYLQRDDEVPSSRVSGTIAVDAGDRSLGQRFDALRWTGSGWDATSWAASWRVELDEPEASIALGRLGNRVSLGIDLRSGEPETLVTVRGPRVVVVQAIRDGSIWAQVTGAGDEVVAALPAAGSYSLELRLETASESESDTELVVELRASAGEPRFFYRRLALEQIPEIGPAPSLPDARGQR